MCVDHMCSTCKYVVNTLLTFHFARQSVSANRTDLEQLTVKLQSIRSIISKYREHGGLRALDHRVENFCL
jgi:ATP-dependent Lon protease